MMDTHELEGSLSDITAPTLVLHGTHDPLFPMEHGEALADLIPNTRLVVLERVGHQVPPPSAWPLAVDELLKHTDQPPGYGRA